MKPTRNRLETGPQLPWWRIRMVWVVLAGPAIVVVAGLATAFIAVRGADEVVAHEERGRFADKPALQGRNHATTGEGGERR
ncbi:MAG TPA: nitrogen fixation protein FixH [Rubrivivax sp.]